MNTHDRISQRLKEWRVQAPSSPSFRAGVWDRIEEGRRDAGGLSVVRSRLGTIGVACLVTLVVSGWTGHAYARAKVHEDRDALAASYLSRLDARTHSGIAR